MSTMAEMVVNGVSTRKVSNVFETLCGTSVSKSTVSEACKDLSAAVDSFRNRPLTEEYAFLMIDATYFKVRENGRVTAKALMIALGTRLDGIRENIGFGIYDNESEWTWQSFLRSLKQRGLRGVKMVTSDAHEGLRKAIMNELDGVPWQRCQTHFCRNVVDKAPKQYQTEIHDRLTDIYNSENIEKARKKFDELVKEFSDVAGRAVDCLSEGFDSVMTVMELPRGMRKYFRTSNHLERLNKELKRRSDAIGIFPNQESLLRLMGSVMMEENEKYCDRRNIKFSTGDAAKMPECYAGLSQIAEEQRKLELAV